MKNDLSCEIVKDLLPSYIDSLTSEVTNGAILAHLKDCEDCRKAYERMSTPEEPLPANDATEIDFLKSQKKKAKKAVICGIGFTIILVLAVLFVRIFVVGSEINPNSIVSEVTVNGNSVDISGTIVDSAGVVSGVTIKGKGDKVEVFVSERADLFPGSDHFESSYSAGEKVNEVYLNGKLIWQDGISLSPGTGRIAELKHPYVGDASANSNLARELGVYRVLGECTMELKTANEPYGWIIESSRTFYDEQSRRLSGELPKYGTVLLALVDNLGYVEFHYRESIDGHESPRAIKVTAENASLYAGTDIKKAVEKASDLQRLIEKLELYSGSVFENTLADNVNDDINIEIDCKARGVYGVSFGLTVNGRTVSGGGMTNADGSMIQNDKINYSIIPEELGISLGENDKTVLSIVFTDREDKTLYESSQIIDVYDKKYNQGEGYKRSFTFEGNESEGYVLY